MAGRGKARKRARTNADPEEPEPGPPDESVGSQPGLSELEALPDDVLQRIFELVGLRDAYGICKLSCVSRRVREVAAVVDWPELDLTAEEDDELRLARPPGSVSVLEAKRLFLRLSSRDREVRLRRLVVDIPGSGDELDIGHNPFEPKFWMSRSRKHPMILVTCLAKLRGLQSVRIRHCHVAAAASNSESGRDRKEPRARHTYVAALLRALAPSAATLEDLSVGFTLVDPVSAPEGAARKAILDALRSLVSLRRLDISGYCRASEAPGEFQGHLLAAIAVAAPGIRSLAVMDRYTQPPDCIPSLFTHLEEIELNSDVGGGFTAAETRFACDTRLKGVALRSSGELSPASFDDLATALEDRAADAVPLERLEVTWTWTTHSRVMYGLPRSLVAALGRTTSLRSLALGLDPATSTLDGGFFVSSSEDVWRSFGALPRLRSLSLGLAVSPRLPPVLEAVGRLPALQTLALAFNDGPIPGDESAAVNSALRRFASALPAMPALRSLSLRFPAARDGAVSRAPPALRAAVLRAAAPFLERLWLGCDVDFVSRDEMEALAACRRLRSLHLRIEVRQARQRLSPAELVDLLAPLAAVPPAPPGCRAHCIELGSPVDRPIEWSREVYKEDVVRRLKGAMPSLYAYVVYFVP